MSKTLVILVAIACVSCARFATKQTDLSYDTNGAPQRAITTRASTITFFSASSELTKFRASQTDKTQSASVGAVNLQSSEPTNTVNQLTDTALKIIWPK